MDDELGVNKAPDPVQVLRLEQQMDIFMLLDKKNDLHLSYDEVQPLSTTVSSTRRIWVFRSVG